jgi:hypothetical protein
MAGGGREARKTQEGLKDEHAVVGARAGTGERLAVGGGWLAGWLAGRIGILGA